MDISKPYRRTVRQLIDGSYSSNGNGDYIEHKSYAKDPVHYVRAYLLIQKDLIDLLDYVEPSDQNLKCYSYRIHEVLLRACIEFEANCKAILIENGYPKKENDLKIPDYFKIEKSHLLSKYKVLIPAWTGFKGEWQPFAQWASGDHTLTWYQAYNATKHNRHNAFQSATFEAMLNAVCGCVVILSAQFRNEDFSGRPGYILRESSSSFEESIGSYFKVSYPEFEETERYKFNWQRLKLENDPFDNFDYSKC